jgi:hypothetical protein
VRRGGGGFCGCVLWHGRGGRVVDMYWRAVIRGGILLLRHMHSQTVIVHVVHISELAGLRFSRHTYYCFKLITQLFSTITRVYSSDRATSFRRVPILDTSRAM